MTATTETAMKQYIGTKIIKSKPMNRLDYNNLRGWTVPPDENPEDEGYLVEYIDGGKPNVAGFDGYISWSPKEQHEAAYRPTNGISFGLAIEAMKKGLKVCRTGWNGKGMFLFLVPGSTFQVNRAPLLGIYPEGTTINYCPHIDMKAADGSIFAWNPNQLDVLADDWMIVD